MNVRRISSMVGSVVVFGFLAASSVEAGHFKVNMNINLEPFRPLSLHQEVLPAPQPCRSRPESAALWQDELRFIYPPGLGFYLAVGVPYELCYVNRSYYLFSSGRWLRANSRRGPWIAPSYRELPPALRHQRIEGLREYRQHGTARLREFDRQERERFRGRNHRQYGDREFWREQDLYRDDELKGERPGKDRRH